MERVRGWTNHLLDAYPRPIRPYVRLTLQVVVAMVILFAIFLLVASLVSLIEWMIGPPRVMLDQR
jgi:hypothetical protein